MTDFVGWLPMPDGGAREAALTADYNAEMIEQRARFRRVRDRSIFVGNPDDVVADVLRSRTCRGSASGPRRNFDFAGYVTGFDPRPTTRSRAAAGRARLPRRTTASASSPSAARASGEPLLRRVLDAVPARAAAACPSCSSWWSRGPRIDPASLPRRRGVTVRGYVPDLYRHLAACDLAVVQGGLTTSMELTANRRPFLYVPLRNHFEQNFHVRHRLERYGAGRCLTYERRLRPGRCWPR